MKKISFGMLLIVVYGACLLWSSPQVQAAATNTSCPAAGTARAAQMPALAHGNHQVLVYVYNEVPPATSAIFGHLKRYDTVTKQKAVFWSGPAIDEAQVSRDGQWVLFVVPPDPRNPTGPSELQLVRMDGQFWQTLYCTTRNQHITTIQWLGPYVVFDLEDDSTNVVSVMLLRIATGQLTQVLRAPLTHPYRTVTWLDTTRVYVVQQNQSGPSATLFLFNVGTSQLAHVTDLSQGPPATWTFDSSVDAKTLFVGNCEPPTVPGKRMISEVRREVATGGPSTQIFFALNSCLAELRAEFSHTLLFTIFTPNGDFGRKQIWKMHEDGSGTMQLYDNGGAHTEVLFNRFTQFTWSNVSRDGTMYAFEEHHTMACNQTLSIGQLSGGTPQVFAFTCPGRVGVAGWTTF